MQGTHSEAPPDRFGRSWKTLLAGRLACCQKYEDGRVNSDTAGVSIAKMKSPSGWSEPGQTPEFDEYTVVLDGVLHVRLKDREFDIAAGQAVSIRAGEWVQYSTPDPEGAEYIAVCLPAFSLELAHRDAEIVD